jgi:hypothetical protein
MYGQLVVHVTVEKKKRKTIFEILASDLTWGIHLKKTAVRELLMNEEIMENLCVTSY